jgi:hypothetical protein
VGKSTLANVLQKRIGGTVVEVDTSVMPNQNTYVPSLDARATRRRVDASDRSPSPPRPPRKENAFATPGTSLAPGREPQ